MVWCMPCITVPRIYFLCFFPSDELNLFSSSSRRTYKFRLIVSHSSHYTEEWRKRKKLWGAKAENNTHMPRRHATEWVICRRWMKGKMFGGSEEVFLSLPKKKTKHKKKTYNFIIANVMKSVLRQPRCTQDEYTRNKRISLFSAWAM